MQIVKLSYPAWWDKDWGGQIFLKETPGNSGCWGDYKFEINSEIQECDYWIIYDDIDKYLVDTATCPPENILFITGEVIPYWEYPDKFLSQFNTVMSARKDIIHAGFIHQRHTCVWHVKRDYDFLKELKPPAKKHILSTITSDACFDDGHKNRYAFINKLKGHFKDDLTWFGRGENPIGDKWDALIDFKYSIAIENSSYWGYFTEKILDCYLSYTMPIYYGCPNIVDYFEAESLILLDPNDFKKSISIIENALENDQYSKNFQSIVRMREKILDELAFFPYVTNWIEKNKDVSMKKQKRLLKGRDFLNGPRTIKQALYRAKKLSFLYLNGFS